MSDERQVVVAADDLRRMLDEHFYDCDHDYGDCPVPRLQAVLDAARNAESRPATSP
jgi:hypothetical protein